MLKQLTVSLAGIVLGAATLSASTAPAMADRGKAVEPAPRYVYEVEPQRRGKTATAQRKKKSFESTLDFETKAVWRNLRPTRFDD